MLHTYLISCSTSKNTKIETQEIHLSSGYARKNRIIHSLDPSSKTHPWLTYIKISKQICICFKNKKLVRYHVLFFIIPFLKLFDAQENYITSDRTFTVNTKMVMIMQLTLFALYFIALSRRNVKENMAIQGTPHNNQETVLKK